ncbi:hypothetical protein COV20_02075 [Candidatus Woesearchaeota archaeon CG10_big_fil_rev_8_21_14_0_10_45_16]|nr:MAG: hypothetical protein COV20_02075 [Candidatus Woesearchaeota archaeon CG10_big_fil_rev_8_21_14_0_10_45_16]
MKKKQKKTVPKSRRNEPTDTSFKKLLKGIENELVNEKKRIDKTVLKARQSKLTDSLELVENRRKEISFLVGKLRKLHNKIMANVHAAEQQIAVLHPKLEKSKSALQEIASLAKEVGSLDSSAREIDKARKELLKKEKVLLSKITRSLKNNKKTLKSHGMSSFISLQKVLNDKVGSLRRSMDALRNHQQSIFKDKAILLDIRKRREKVVKDIEAKIKALAMSKKKLLKKKSIVDTQVEKFEKEARYLEKKKSQLLKKMKNIKVKAN